MDASELLDTTARCLARYEAWFAGGSLLAAVSGGRDSTLLAWILAELRADGRLPAPVVLAHVDHGAHPDSPTAADAVAGLADELDFPFACEALAGLVPTEAAWREARYAALIRMARQHGARLVLTAHHADDDLETVLFRMLRGTGPRGLAGIPEFRRLAGDVAVARPLLPFRARVLHQRLAELGCSFVEDPTNLDLRYARNRLRHETVPALRAATGDHLDTTLLELNAAARRVTALLEASAARILAESARFPTPWRCELRLPPGDGAPPRNFLEEALCGIHERLDPVGLRPRWSLVHRILDLLPMAAGQRVHGSDDLLVERTRDGLLFVRPGAAGMPPDLPVELPVDGSARFGSTEWSIRSTPAAEPPLSPSPGFPGPDGPAAVLDAADAPRPWYLRRRRPGDRFWPLGAPGPVDLRRFLKNRHVPRFDRGRMPLLVDAADRVLWVPGVEVAQPCRVDLATRACVVVKVEIVGSAVPGPTSY